MGWSQWGSQLSDWAGCLNEPWAENSSGCLYLCGVGIDAFSSACICLVIVCLPYYDITS